MALWYRGHHNPLPGFTRTASWTCVGHAPTTPCLVLLGLETSLEIGNAQISRWFDGKNSGGPQQYNPFAHVLSLMVLGEMGLLVRSIANWAVVSRIWPTQVVT